VPCRDGVGCGQIRARSPGAHRRLAVHGGAVVGLAADRGTLQRRLQIGDAVVADDEQVPRRDRAEGRLRQVDEGAQSGLLVVAARLVSAAGPVVEMGKLHAQDGGLKLVQTRVVAEQFVVDLVARAVEAQHACALGDPIVGGHDRAAVA
jgi:hypothetical protein